MHRMALGVISIAVVFALFNTTLLAQETGAPIAADAVMQLEQTEAAQTGAGITLDGSFQDWENVSSSVTNMQHTLGDTRQLKTLKTYISGNNLYLYVERWEARQGEYWDLDAVFFDNTRVNKGIQFQKPPWMSKKVKVPTVDVLIYKDRAVNDYVAEVVFSSYYTSTYSVSDDFLKAEFMIPLSLLGVDSQLTDVVIGVNSVSGNNQVEDWIPRTGPLIVAGGPVFGVVEPYIMLVLILIVFIIVYRKYKKKKYR